jgi:tetratricopeptide (TPR) repeat protein
MKSEEAGSLMDYEQGSVGTTWTISLKAVAARNEGAVNLIRLWAFLDNNDLWHGLLRAAADDKQQPGWLREMACNEVRFMNAVQLLLRYSMIEARESVRGSYMVHPVVHRWTAHIQNNDEKRESLLLAMMVVGSMVPSCTTGNYSVQQRRLFPHAERCKWRWQEVQNPDKDGSEFLMVLAKFLHNLSKLYENEASFHEILACEVNLDLHKNKIRLGPGHTETLNAVNDLANVYQEYSRLAEAKALYDRVLQGQEKVLGPDHNSTLDTFYSRADIYQIQGRLAEARAIMFDRALQGYEAADMYDRAAEDFDHAADGFDRAADSFDRAADDFDRATDGFDRAADSFYRAADGFESSNVTSPCDGGR